MSRRDSDGNDSIKSIPYEKESSVLQSSQWHKSQQQYRYPPDTFPTPYSINLQSSIVNLCFLNFKTLLNDVRPIYKSNAHIALELFAEAL